MMMPYNYVDLLTLDEKDSKIMPGQKFHLGPHQTREHDPSCEGRPCQIQVNSTIDADIVLRRVIEDRAAILALKSRAAANGAEQMKAKTRQLLLTKILDRQDQKIINLTTKAKHDLVEYNENCKKYIRSFMSAFEHGDMDKLPQHPFLPPVEELERVVNQRKATLVEKVQADDRVKKLQFISSQERVRVDVLKKNEEAFLRAIELSKQQFTDSCGAWRNHVNILLLNSNMPHHAQDFGNFNNAQVSTPKINFMCPPEKNDAQDTKRPHAVKETTAQSVGCSNPGQISGHDYFGCENEPVTPEGPVAMERRTEYMSPEVYAKSLIGFFRPMFPGCPGEAASTGNKKRKTERPPTPPSNPAIVLRRGENIIDKRTFLDMAHEESGAHPKDNDDEKTNTWRG